MVLNQCSINLYCIFINKKTHSAFTVRHVGIAENLCNDEFRHKMREQTAAHRGITDWDSPQSGADPFCRLLPE